MKQQLITLILLICLGHCLQAQDYLPINLDTLIHSNKKYEFIKLTASNPDSIKDAHYYEGGAIIFPKGSRIVFTDTLYIQDLTGIPTDKMLTKTNRIKYPTEFRLYLYKRDDIKYCHPTKSMPYFSKPVYNLKRVIVPIHWSEEHTTTRILNPKYKDEYPDIRIKETILSFPTNHLPYAVPKEELNDTIKEELNNIFAQPSEFEDEENYYYLFPSGYYYDASTIDCEESNKELIIKIQKALIKKGYEVEVTGVLDNKTKAAYTQFQKDNGLGSCHAGGSQVVLQALGIEH